MQQARAEVKTASSKQTLDPDAESGETTLLFAQSLDRLTRQLEEQQQQQLDDGPVQKRSEELEAENRTLRVRLNELEERLGQLHHLQEQFRAISQVFDPGSGNGSSQTISSPTSAIEPTSDNRAV